jgi:hypothetical protein
LFPSESNEHPLFPEGFGTRESHGLGTHVGILIDTYNKYKTYKNTTTTKLDLH